jgi:small subunit ribosomal protein S6
MRYYETLYIVNPNLENEALDITMGEIRSELEKTKSKLINHRVWGKKRLAYQIENQKYGCFILLQFEGGEQNQMNEFNTWMQLHQSVLRHMTVALDAKPEVYVEEEKEKPVEKQVPESTEQESPKDIETTEDVSDKSSDDDIENKEAK